MNISHMHYFRVQTEALVELLPPSSRQRDGALDGTIRRAVGVPPLLPWARDRAGAGLLLGSGGRPPLPDLI